MFLKGLQNKSITTTNVENPKFREKGTLFRERQKMEACWDHTTPHQRFWIRLQNQRVDQLISDPERFLLRCATTTSW